MNLDHLIGRRVEIRESEPAGIPIAAVIRAVDAVSDSLLLEFAVPARIDAEICPFAIARPHLERDSLASLLDSGSLGCALTCVPQQHHDAARPFDLGWWRGGGATVADLLLQGGERSC